MKKLFVIISVLSIINTTTSYSDEYWNITYGGRGQDRLIYIQEEIDGQFIVAGEAESWVKPESSDCYRQPAILIAKINATGNITWEKRYSISPDHYDYVYTTSFQKTSDNGYIAAGFISSFESKVWALKVNANGTADWQKMFHFNDESNVITLDASVIQDTSDGGYVLQGTYESETIKFAIFLMKFRQDGTVVWSYLFDDPNWDWAQSIQETTDGGFVMAVRTRSPDTLDDNIGIQRLDSEGNLLWQKTYGGSEFDAASDVLQTSDGGYMVAGSTSSFGAGGEDIWILKLDSSGNSNWQKTYGGESNDVAHTIEKTSDGGYVVVGKTNSFGAGKSDIWILKVTSSGEIIWQKTYGGSDDDGVDDIYETADGGYIVAGSTYSFNDAKRNTDGWVLKLDRNGDIPDCDLIKSSTATVGTTEVYGQNSSLQAQEVSVISTAVDPEPHTSLADLTIICHSEISTTTTTSDCQAECSGKFDNCRLACCPCDPVYLDNCRYTYEMCVEDCDSDDDATTSTIKDSICPSEQIYGEHSEEVEFLRYIRDNILNRTSEGQELIRLYYQWGPVIAEAMEGDEEFGEDVKEFIRMFVRDYM